MERALVRWFFLAALLGCGAVAQEGPASQPDARGLCPELITDLVPGISPGLKKEGLAHVEIRRCAPVGGLQLLAWAAGAKDPAISIQMNRFSADRILVNENIVVVIFPGGYDVIEAIEYKGGVPRVVFEDSTHDAIQLMSDCDKVVITLTAQNGKKDGEGTEGRLERA